MSNKPTDLSHKQLTNIQDILQQKLIFVLFSQKINRVKLVFKKPEQNDDEVYVFTLTKKMTSKKKH